MTLPLSDNSSSDDSFDNSLVTEADIERVEIMRARLGDSPSEVAAALRMPYEFVALAFEALDLVVDGGLRLSTAMRAKGLDVDGIKDDDDDDDDEEAAAKRRAYDAERKRRLRLDPAKHEALVTQQRLARQRREREETPEQREARRAAQRVRSERRRLRGSGGPAS